MVEILIVDDDPELSGMLAEYLSTEGFQISTAINGMIAIEHIKSIQYDLVILDVMMPELDGFGVLRHVRSYSDVPILMLTAKGDDVDRIVGLEMGADDYLAKPFNPRELLARIKAVLRRSQNDNVADNQQSITVGDLSIDMGARVAKVNDTVLPLTSTELNILHLLACHQGQVVTKEAIAEHGLGRALEKYDRSVDMHMSHLRKKLTPYLLGLAIVTVRGQGYQLVSDV